MTEDGFERRIPFGSWDELAVARDRLLTEGWEVLPSDSTDTGVRGFSALRAGEPRTLLYWEVYGRPLEPVVRVCSSWEEFVREMQFRVDEDMEKSDDMPSRQVGFVTYGRAASGKAEVFRLGVELLQAGGETARASLIAILLKSRHPSKDGLQALNPEYRER
jgi:hypothetical protein